jgi:glucokinase
MTYQALAGDIGGTNARLALVTVGGPAEVRIVHEARYQSSTAPGLAPLVIRHLAETGRVTVRALAREIGVPRTTIINDFHAVGYGLHSLSGDVATRAGSRAWPPGCRSASSSPMTSPSTVPRRSRPAL